MNRDFIDKYAKIGRPFKAPDSEVRIEVQPQSRSLKELSKFDAESRKIIAEIKNGKLRLDFSHVIGDKVIVKKVHAIRFARWILKTYEVKNERKTNLDRQSRNDV